MRVEVRLLDTFTVTADAVTTPSSDWSRRSAAWLVQLLALSPDRRLHRDRIVDTLWPDVEPKAVSQRLHTAGHYARAILGHQDAVGRAGEVLTLFPVHDVVVDAMVFAAAADEAVTSAAVPQCEAALQLAGDLLPDELAASWLDPYRRRFRQLRLDLLRCAGRWEELLRIEPSDEEAHLALLREAVAEGNRGEANRRYADMERVLSSEFGVAPGAEANALRRQLEAPVGTNSGLPTTAVIDSVPGVAGLRAGGSLVERDQQLSQLHAAARRTVEQRRGAVVLVPGEAGAGKSALVQGFLASHLPAQMQAFSGSCDDLMAPRTLGPFRDMADLHDGLGSLLEAGPEELMTRFAAVLRREPAAVVVEDVHWADDATMDAIRYLARRLTTVPTLLVLTFRDEDLPLAHPLRRLLGGLAGADVTRVGLPPLSVEALVLLGAESEREALEIHRVTRGNPFFSTEVLAANGRGVPATVRDAVLARMAALDPSVRDLLGRLSVVPTRIERWLAEALAATVDEVLAAERSGMLHVEASSLSFRHELARQAIESSLTGGERVRANAMVVQALLCAEPVDATRLVHHAREAALAEVLREHGPLTAAEAARLGSHRQAAQILEAVLEHAEGLPEAERARLSTSRAYSLYLVNHFEEAMHEAQRGAAHAARTTMPELVGEALLVLSRVAYFARGPLRARQAAGQAVEALRATAAPASYVAALIEMARAHSNLGLISIVGERCDVAEEMALEAAQIATTLSRNDLLAQALCYLGDARIAARDPDGIATLDRAITLAAADTRVETRVRCLVNAAGAAYRTGRFTDAERYVDEGLRLAADGEFFAGEYRLRLTRAAVRSSAGAWDDSIAELVSLLASDGEPGIMAPLASCLLSRLQARRAEPAAAATLAVAAREWAGCEDPFVAGPLCVAAVEVGWLDGSLGDLTPEAERVLALLQRHGPSSLLAELLVYLRRLGVDVAPVIVPAEAESPWHQTLGGSWRAAARTWEQLGDRYERALVLATAPDAQMQQSGRALLAEMGATGTLAAL